MAELDPPATVTSMVEVLELRAAAMPERRAYCFLIDGEQEGPALNYAQLQRQARALAVALRDAAEPGDRAVLVFAPGIEFLTALFGCLYAGVVAVPAYPPRLDRAGQSWQSLGNLMRDARPRLLLTMRNLAPFLAGAFPGIDFPLSILCTEEVDAARGQSWREPRLAGDRVALLQYTSGSTASPRGVLVTHANLMHNERMIQTALEHAGTGMGVCWLPMYHDFGLIAGALQAVFHGASMIFMSPLCFLQKPLRWLQAVARYGADTSGAPNFGFDLCVDRISPEEARGLDLSRWSVVGVGSEPVNPHTLQRFADRFAASGFKPEVFYPCYGLAEATLLVTGGAKSARPVVRTFAAPALELGRAVSSPDQSSAGRTLVGCGHPWLGQQVLIVDPETQRQRPDGTVGEVWVSGPSVAKGYWNRPEETRHTFQASLADTGHGPFLRTGDLGFVQDGELFLTGRLKEVILIHGRNHYPQDVEETVQSVHAGLRRGGGAAFEIRQGDQPRLVVVQEVERRCRELDVAGVVGDIRQAVAERHDLQVFDLLLLDPGTLPRTASGKIQRHLCRAGYEQHTLRRWRGYP